MSEEFKPKLIRMISHKLVRTLAQSDDIVVFPQNTTLFYEGHVPIVAYLLLYGHVDLVKRKKIIESITPDTIIGLEHLMYNKASQYSVIAAKGSKVLFLDKSSLLATDHKQLQT